MQSPIMQAFRTIQTASNSDMMLRQQLANLPNGKEVLEILNQCGGDYEKTARLSMESLGVSMNDLANLAKSIGL